jgi:hypothetical protein
MKAMKFLSGNKKLPGGLNVEDPGVPLTENARKNRFDLDHVSCWRVS